MQASSSHLGAYPHQDTLVYLSQPDPWEKDSSMSLSVPSGGAYRAVISNGLLSRVARQGELDAGRDVADHSAGAHEAVGDNLQQKACVTFAESERTIYGAVLQG